MFTATSIMKKVSFAYCYNRKYANLNRFIKGLRFVKSKQGDPLYITVPKENAGKTAHCV